MDVPSARALAGFKAISWIAIIEQLSRTLSARTLRTLGLGYPEFGILSHLSYGHPPEKTVTAIAADMQQTQPTVTKTVQRLLAKGYLKASPSAADGRSKILTLTAKGAQVHARAIALLGPAIERAVADWRDEDLAQLFVLLDRLKTYLDANRGPPGA